MNSDLADFKCAYLKIESTPKSFMLLNVSEGIKLPIKLAYVQKMHIAHKATSEEYLYVVYFVG